VTKVNKYRAASFPPKVTHENGVSVADDSFGKPVVSIYEVVIKVSRRDSSAM
jgi:hypothetical protein